MLQKMNKKSQIIFFAFMMAIVIIVLALGLIYSVKEAKDNARTSLDCTNTSISDYDKATCLITDISLPYFIGGLFALAGLIIGARIIFG